jgi:glycosyltransferase involved in cell wall biosynthesis
VEPEGSELTHPRKEETAPLRIVVDGRKLGDGGIGVYIDNLVRGLLEIGGAEVALIARPAARERVEYSSQVKWMLENSATYSLDEMFLMGRRLNFSKFDLFHAPHYTLPFGIPIPSVVTIHDLIHVHYPERFYYPWVARRLIRSAVKRAHAVITVSQQTRRAVLDLCDVQGSKVVCVPNGVPSFLRDTPVNLVAGRRYCELAPFFLSIFSTIKPHKGLLDLIGAYKAYRALDTWSDIGSRCPCLVLAGYGTEEILHSTELLSVIGETEGVHIAGPVSRDELAVLYRKATALIVPSLLEGFCLPALEAQACGTPVVCRPVPALQELVTEADVVAHDNSVSALAAAMVQGMNQGVTGQRAIPFKHLELYSCARTASRVLDVYRRALHPERGA